MYRIRLENIPEEHPEWGAVVLVPMWIKYKAVLRPSIFKCRRLHWEEVARSELRRDLVR